MSDASVGTALAPEPGRGWARILRPLAMRDFRLLFSGETISLLGDQFHFVALAWLVLRLFMLGGLALTPLSLAAAGLLVDLGAATLCFAVAGGLIMVAALAGVVWGVPAQMREA